MRVLLVRGVYLTAILLQWLWVIFSLMAMCATGLLFFLLMFLACVANVLVFHAPMLSTVHPGVVNLTYGVTTVITIIALYSLGVRALVWIHDAGVRGVECTGFWCVRFADWVSARAFRLELWLDAKTWPARFRFRFARKTRIWQRQVGPDLVVALLAPFLGAFAFTALHGHWERWVALAFAILPIPLVLLNLSTLREQTIEEIDAWTDELERQSARSRAWILRLVQDPEEGWRLMWSRKEPEQ